MNCILPIIFSVTPVVLLVGGMTALVAMLEGTQNSYTFYGTAANDMTCDAVEDARLHVYPKVCRTSQPSATATTPQPAVVAPTPWSDTVASPMC